MALFGLMTVAEHERLMREERGFYYEQRKLIRDLNKISNDAWEDYRNRCCKIASLETPRCASIGKRMAKIAREGLE